MISVPKYNRDLKVRVMRDEDREPARRLAARAFGCNTLSWYQRETCLVGEDTQGALVTCLEYVPEDDWWGPARIPAAGVGNVATDPEAQGQGHAGGLMVGAAHHLRERGCQVCPLWPFSIAYYAKFGWVCPTADLRITVWPDLVRRLDAPSGTLRPAGPEDLPQVLALYTAGAQRTNGQSVRAATWWEAKGPLDRLQVMEGAGGFRAYGYCHLERVKEGQGVRAVVRELHGVDFAAQLQWVRGLAELPEIVSIELHLPCDSLFVHAFPERHDIRRPRRLGLRVLDVAGALACLRPPADLVASVSFEVWDWVLSESRPVRVTADVSDGAVEVREGAGADALRCDINSFTQLFAGGMTAGEARALGGLEGGDRDVDRACDRLLYGRPPYRVSMEMG